MIGKLRGIVDEINDDAVILDVAGVGYQAFCSARTLGALSEGDSTQLIIETHVREDHIHLFGFSDTIEREWFRTLASVQRVGNRMALTILGAYTPEQLAHAILAKDITAFSRISGIGPKLAERIVTELKDKAAKLPTSGFQLSQKSVPETQNLKLETSFVEDAISALVNLGYSRSEAYGATVKASQLADNQASLDTLIKSSLKELLRA